RKISEPARLRIELRKAITRAHPQSPIVIFQDADDHRTGQAVPDPVYPKMARLPVHEIQAVRGTDPEIVFAIGINIIDCIVAQAVPTRIMHKMFEDAGIYIQPVQSAIIGANPENTIAIGEKRIEPVAARTIWI